MSTTSRKRRRLIDQRRRRRAQKNPAVRKVYYSDILLSPGYVREAVRQLQETSAFLNLLRRSSDSMRQGRVLVLPSQRAGKTMQEDAEVVRHISLGRKVITYRPGSEPEYVDPETWEKARLLLAKRLKEQQEYWKMLYYGSFLPRQRRLRDGEPCSHPGCLSHKTHPCEGCGRMGGKPESATVQHIRMQEADYFFTDYGEKPYL